MDYWSCCFSRLGHGLFEIILEGIGPARVMDFIDTPGRIIAGKSLRGIGEATLLYKPQ